MARNDEHMTRDNPAARAESDQGFVWPSREHAERLGHMADEVARQGLDRLRARTTRSRTRAAKRKPAARLASRLVVPATDPDVSKEAEPGGPRHDPWEREFDELAERLVAELHRALDP